MHVWIDLGGRHESMSDVAGNGNRSEQSHNLQVAASRLIPNHVQGLQPGQSNLSNPHRLGQVNDALPLVSGGSPTGHVPGSGDDSLRE